MKKIVTSYYGPDLDGVACMFAYTEYLRKKGIEPNKKQKTNAKQSKFSNKYSERIKSIKESDEKYKKTHMQK